MKDQISTGMRLTSEIRNPKSEITKPIQRFFMAGFALLFLFGLPLISSAVNIIPTRLVPECNTRIVPLPNGTRGFADPCGWPHIVALADNLLKFMVGIAVPVAAIAFAWAGWLYLSARGNPSQISKAHGIFLNVAIGLVIVLVAWLVVDQILKAFADPNSYVSVFR